MKTFKDLKIGDHIYYVIERNKSQQNNFMCQLGDPIIDFNFIAENDYKLEDKYKIYDCEIIDYIYPSTYQTPVYHMKMNGSNPYDIGSSYCEHIDEHNVTLKLKNSYGIGFIKVPIDTNEYQVFTGSYYFIKKADSLKYIDNLINKRIKTNINKINKLNKEIETLKDIQNKIDIE